MDTQFSSSRHAKNLNTIRCDILKKKKNCTEWWWTCSDGNCRCSASRRFHFNDECSLPSKDSIQYWEKNFLLKDMSAVTLGEAFQRVLQSCCRFIWAVSVVVLLSVNIFLLFFFFFVFMLKSVNWCTSLNCLIELLLFAFCTWPTSPTCHAITLFTLTCFPEFPCRWHWLQ